MNRLHGRKYSDSTFNFKSIGLNSGDESHSVTWLNTPCSMS